MIKFRFSLGRSHGISLSQTAGPAASKPAGLCGTLWIEKSAELLRLSMAK